jgi:hypothetical protein
MGSIQSFDVVNTQASSGEPSRLDMDEMALDFPNRRGHEMVFLPYQRPPTVASETIWIGEDEYTSQPPGAWMLVRRLGTLPRDALTYFRAAHLVPAVGDEQLYVLTGQETIDGIPCRVYTNIGPTFDPSGFGQIDIEVYWVGIADHIVYQSQVRSGGEPGEYTDVHRLRQINASLAITPPARATLVTLSPSPTPIPTPVPAGWTIVTTPEPEGGTSRLAGVVVVAADDGWAVGSRPAELGQALIEHWNGQTWQPVPQPAPRKSELLAVAATGPADVWAVGAGAGGPAGVPLPLTLHWDGRTWQQIPAPALSGPGSSLSAVTALAPDDVWAVGRRYYGAPIVLHWNGVEWRQVPFGVATRVSDVALNGISGRAPDDVWLVGAQPRPRRVETLIAHWDGRRWQEVPGPNPGLYGNRLYAVSATQAGTWAVGTYDDQPLIIRWTGQQWEQVPGPARRPGVSRSELFTITGGVGNTAWAAGDDGQTLVLRWDGRMWQPVPSPNASPRDNRILGLTVAPNGDLWAAGTNGLLDMQQQLALRYRPP